MVETLEYFSDEPLVEYENGLQEYLPAELLWAIDRVHMRNRLPIFSSTSVGLDGENEGAIGEPIP